jgi:dTDP-4-dehydrorhamnose reductase
MKILVTGANGQLGADIVASMANAGQDVIGLTHEDLDIGNLMEVKNQIMRVQPQVVINTAAFHNVDACEKDMAMAKRINTDAPGFMARMCRYRSARFIHISTDYVFDGKQNKPYAESDNATPLNVYGLSKLMGEKKIEAEGGDYMIARVSALYGTHPCRAKNGLNFIQLMLKLAKEKGEVRVVNDEFVSPTATADVAKQLTRLLSSDVQGITHMTSEGQCSWYEFADAIFRNSNTDVKLHSANSSDFPAKIARPKYSVLENSLLKRRGVNLMPQWEESLKNYLNTINYTTNGE